MQLFAALQIGKTIDEIPRNKHLPARGANLYTPLANNVFAPRMMELFRNSLGVAQCWNNAALSGRLFSNVYTLI
jgi:hypothetical protein